MISSDEKTSIQARARLHVTLPPRPRKRMRVEHPYAASRLRSWYQNAILIFTPIHASWLNQIEIYFSIVQRKVFTPSEAKSIPSLRVRLRRFQTRYQELAKPFEWKFTRKDLRDLLHRLSKHEKIGTESKPKKNT